MDFVVEALNPTRTKIALTFSPADVDAAITKAVNATRRDLSLPGFRKGKVPPAVVERRYGDELLTRATEEAINAAVREVMESKGLEPFSRIEMDAKGSFARGTDYACSLSFDVLPTIDFPTYEGLPVEQFKVVVDDADVDSILNRVRDNFAIPKDVEETRLPTDGDLVDVDYDGFENGEPVKDVSGTHFTLVLGEKQAIADFEALVRTILPGETKEGAVTFPEDYGHKDLAGKTVTMRVKVNSIKTRELPEIDDALAAKTGHETLEKLREAIRTHTTEERSNNAKGMAMRKLLDIMLDNLDVPLPESMVQTQIRRLHEEKVAPLRRSGQTVPELSDEDRLTLRGAVEAAVRPDVFLIALGKREKLVVSDQELEMHIYSMASRAGQDYRQMSDFYHRSGLAHELRDRILADKAMEHVYSKAVITEVDAPKPEERA